MPTLKELIDTLPQQGVVEWIGIRPARKAPLQVFNQIDIQADHGKVSAFP